MSDPGHAWVWAVLPAGARRVRVLGAPALAATLREAGLDASEGDVDGDGRDRPDALVATVPLRPSPAQCDALLRALREGPPSLVAVIDGALTPPERARPLRRAATPLRSLPASLAAGRTARALTAELRGSGREVSALALGPTTRGHALGRRAAPFHRRALPTGAVVVGAGDRDGLPATVLQAAARAAAGALGIPLRHRATTVLGTGTVMALVRGPAAEEYLLRIAAAGAGELLLRAAATLGALAAASPPDAVARHLAPPLAAGRLGPVAWTLERRLPGAPPRRPGAALWADSVAFLVALRAVPPGERPARPQHRDDAEVIALHTGAAGQRTLERLADDLDSRLGALPLGWQHGDFWPANLLARGGRLGTVLDWDGASAAAPPGLDLLHLEALGDARTRRLPHGLRCSQVLWPVARAGGSPRMRAYCRALGLPADGRTLEGLALAYWLQRVARDLRMFADRPARADWMEANLHRPLSDAERL